MHAQNARYTLKANVVIEPPNGHPKQKELESIRIIHDNTPTICEYVLQDLNKGKIIKRRTG